MKTKSLLTLVILTLTFFISSQSAKAETEVDMDIVTDTVWTEAMSPIILKGQDRNHTTIRVANGAKLTIEAGVTVLMEKGMSLHITSQCLRGFGADEACYRNKDGSIILPKLTAKGTQAKPIYFTSAQKNPEAGDWGSVIIEAKDSDVEWASFLYGGVRSKRAFVEVYDSNFENNTVMYSNTLGLRARGEIKGNVIRYNKTGGVFCADKCTLTGNFIAENGGVAVKLETSQGASVVDNFIYKNSREAVLSDVNYEIPFAAEDNYFIDNGGGIDLYRSHDDITITKNNFLRNANFAIQSHVNFTGDKEPYKLPQNWFGIDTGPSSAKGNYYYVSDDYDASDFSKDGWDFSLPPTTQAAKTYSKYLDDNDLDNSFFETKVERSVLIGDSQKAGSILLYSVKLKNITTKEVNDALLRITIPNGQELMLCSLLTGDSVSSFDLTSVCNSVNPTDVSYKFREILWKPESISALKDKTIYFATLLKADFEGTATSPRLVFERGGKKYPLSYTIGGTVKIEENSAITTTATTTTTTTATTTQTKTTTADTATQTAVGATTTIDQSFKDYLAKGTVVREVINGVLYYVLKADDGNSYMLFNKYRWKEIDNFTKGNNKSKRIGVSGKYHVGIRGSVIGIDFDSFDILD